MKKFTSILACFVVVFFFGCKKEATNQYLSDKNDILNQARYDSDVLEFLSGAEIVVTKSGSSERSFAGSIDEKAFTDLYQKAVSDKNEESRKQVALYMGFSNSNEFWALMEKNRNARKKIQEKYDLSQLSKADWIRLKYSFQISTKNGSTDLSSARNPILFDDLKAISSEVCADQQSACKDEALATYAYEQVGCVGAGALGWTIIGGLVFLACEAASNYHLHTMKASCDANYRVCIAQRPH
jgi:hypothetical protein